MNTIKTIARKYWLNHNNQKEKNRGMVQILKLLSIHDPEFLTPLEKQSLKFEWIMNDGKKEDF